MAEAEAEGASALSGGSRSTEAEALAEGSILLDGIRDSPAEAPEAASCFGRTFTKLAGEAPEAANSPCAAEAPGEELSAWSAFFVPTAEAPEGGPSPPGL